MAVQTVALIGAEEAASLSSASIATVDPAGLLFGVPGPFIGPEPSAGRVPLATLPQLEGVGFLGQLALLSRSELATFMSEHPEKVADVLAAPPAASQVAAWWAQTPATARSALANEAPSLVGNLEGLPYEARDLANRRFLAETVDGIRAQLAAGVGRAVRDELEARLYMLGEVSSALTTGVSGEARTLVSLDPSGDGRAVIAVGPVSTADYVTFLVPGMYYGVAAQLGDWADTADALVSAQEAWVARLGITTDDGTAPQLAAIAWIGYHTPTLVSVASIELAREGEAALTASLQGLAAERGADRPYVSVLAHSYGSTAVMLALQENDVRIDALAMVGSPGSPARTVSQLKVTGGNVWVGAAEWDPIPGSGVFGSQPLSPDYGAHRFGVASVKDPLLGVTLDDSLSHNDYFTAGTASMRNMSLIALGRGDLVLGTDGSLALASRALAR